MQIGSFDPAHSDGASDAGSRGMSSLDEGGEAGSSDFFSDSELERDADMGVGPFWLAQLVRLWTCYGRSAGSAAASGAHFSRRHEDTADLIAAVSAQLPRDILADACNGEIALRLIYSRRLYTADKQWVKDQRSVFDNLHSSDGSTSRLDSLLFHELESMGLSANNGHAMLCGQTLQESPHTQTSSNCFHPPKDSSTRSGTRLLSISVRQRPENVDHAALSFRGRMWRRWRIRQSVPKRKLACRRYVTESPTTRTYHEGPPPLS